MNAPLDIDCYDLIHCDGECESCTLLVELSQQAGAADNAYHGSVYATPAYRAVTQGSPVDDLICLDCESPRDICAGCFRRKKMEGLIMKYFVLNPMSKAINDDYAFASRKAMRAFATFCNNPQLSSALREWADTEEQKVRHMMENEQAYAADGVNTCKYGVSNPKDCQYFHNGDCGCPAAD